MQRCFSNLPGLLGSNPPFPSFTHTAPLFPANPFPCLSCSQKDTQAYTGTSSLWWGEGGCHSSCLFWLVTPKFFQMLELFHILAILNIIPTHNPHHLCLLPFR